MTKEDFFTLIEKNMKDKKFILLCRNIDCGKCILKEKCPTGFNIEHINEYLIKEYEKYKTEILAEKL